MDLVNFIIWHAWFYLQALWLLFYSLGKKIFPQKENQSSRFDQLWKTDRTKTCDTIFMNLLNLLRRKDELGCINLSCKLILLLMYTRTFYKHNRCLWIFHEQVNKWISIDFSICKDDEGLIPSFKIKKFASAEKLCGERQGTL